MRNFASLLLLIAAPGAFAQTAFPWTKVAEFTDGPTTGWNDYSTFSLRHHVYVQDWGEAPVDWLTHQWRPRPVIPWEVDPKTDQVEFRVPDQTPGYGSFILGAKDWSLEWAMQSFRARGVVLVSTTDPSKFKTVRGDLPGLGLCTFSVPDGGFVSIRAMLPDGATDFGNRLRAYRLGVYQIKTNGTIAPVDAASPWAQWQGVVIPPAPDQEIEIRTDGTAPAGAPLQFSVSGRALASAWMLNPGGGQRFGRMEYDLKTRTWTEVGPLGFDGWRSTDATYAGHCLFLKLQKDLVTRWFVRDPAGAWLGMSPLAVFARDGGTHLMIGNPNDRKAPIQIVTPN